MERRAAHFDETGEFPAPFEVPLHEHSDSGQDRADEPEVIW